MYCVFMQPDAVTELSNCPPSQLSQTVYSFCSRHVFSGFFRVTLLKFCIDGYILNCIRTEFLNGVKLFIDKMKKRSCIADTLSEIYRNRNVKRHHWVEVCTVFS